MQTDHKTLKNIASSAKASEYKIWMTEPKHSQGKTKSALRSIILLRVASEILHHTTNSMRPDQLKRYGRNSGSTHIKIKKLPKYA